MSTGPAQAKYGEYANIATDGVTQPHKRQARSLAAVATHRMNACLPKQNQTLTRGTVTRRAFSFTRELYTLYTKLLTRTTVQTESETQEADTQESYSPRSTNPNRLSATETISHGAASGYWMALGNRSRIPSASSFSPSSPSNLQAAISSMSSSHLPRSS